MRRSLKSGLLGVLAVGLIGNLAVFGCSANGDNGGDLATNTTPGVDASKPVISSGGDDSGPATDGVDAAKKPDAAKDAASDAAKDSGPSTPNPGDPCTTANKIYKRSCGKCGEQEAICQAADDAGTLKVSDYGSCDKELGDCVPGTTQACGNCGTQTCSNSCNWNSCIGEPKDNCSPGTVSYITAGCTTPQTYKSASCSDGGAGSSGVPACTIGNYSTTCAAPVNANILTISATAAGTVVGNYSLKATQVGSQAPTSSFGCPGGTVQAGKYPYEIVEVKNATAKVAKVSAWLSGTPAIDTALTAYNTNLPPQDDTALAQCTAANDTCPPGASECSSPWSGLLVSDGNSVTIQPGTSVILRVESYYAIDDTSNTDPTTGPFTLTVRTDSLN
jgi:hypothetical protein